MRKQKTAQLIPFLIVLIFIISIPVNSVKAITFQLSSNYAVQGETVDIEGTGEPGNYVEVYLGETYLDTFYFDDFGNWRGSIQIPAIASDTYKLEVREMAGENETVSIDSRPFRVGLMIVIISPEEGPTGEEVTLTGTGFLPNTLMNIWFDDNLLEESLLTEVDGTLYFFFFVPTVSPGTHEIACIETATGLEAITHYEVTATTSISVNLETVEPGMLIQIQGINFAQFPGGSVDIYFGGSLITTWATAADGTFSGTMKVPPRSDGTYEIEARLRNYDIHASKYVQVQRYRLVAGTKESNYEPGETLSFDIMCNYPINNAYLQVRNPRGALVWTSDTFNTIDYSASISGTTLVHQVPTHTQTSTGNPMVFLDKAPTGTWSWRLYEETEEVMATGTFTVSSPTPPSIPTAIIDGPSVTSYTEGDEITFQGHGVDEDGTIEAYRWTIDGDIVSTDPTFTTSNISPGTYTIYFYVWDDDSQISPPDTIQVRIKNCIIQGGSFCVTPPQVGGAAAAVGAGAVAANALATEPPTTGNVRDNLQKKELKKQKKDDQEKKKEYKKKTKKIKLPFITWNITGPEKIYKREGKLTIDLKNIGTAVATNVTVMLSSTRGIKLDETYYNIKEITPGKTNKIELKFRVSPETSNGVHRIWAELITKPFYEGKKSHYVWTLKTGVIQTEDSPEVKEIMEWLEKEDYHWGQITDTSYPYLMNYDLIILQDPTPTDQTIQNLRTFTEMGNKVIYISTLANNQALLELVGAQELVKEQEIAQTSEINISTTKHPLANKYKLEELRNDVKELAFSDYRIRNAKHLASLTYKVENSISTIPLATVNKIGKGHIVHLNIKSMDQNYKVPRLLKYTVEYLLEVLFIEKRVDVLEKLRKNP